MSNEERFIAVHEIVYKDAQLHGPKDKPDRVPPGSLIPVGAISHEEIQKLLKRGAIRPLVEPQADGFEEEIPSAVLDGENDDGDDDGAKGEGGGSEGGEGGDADAKSDPQNASAEAAKETVAKTAAPKAAKPPKTGNKK